MLFRSVADAGTAMASNSTICHVVPTSGFQAALLVGVVGLGCGGVEVELGRVSSSSLLFPLLLLSSWALLERPRVRPSPSPRPSASATMVRARAARSRIFRRLGAGRIVFLSGWEGGFMRLFGGGVGRAVVNAWLAVLRIRKGRADG